MEFADLTQGIFPEIFAGIVLYIAGFITSKIWQILMRKTNEKKLKRNIRIALNLIYEAEEQIKGEKKGVEKLEYATKRYMEETGTKDYDQAQQQIIKVFNLTKLSH